MNTNINLITSAIVGIFVGAASAYLGSLMILKRMALVGDALSHVALPGIGIALTYGINPFLGAFTALAIGIIIVWRLADKTDLPTEALVGIIFTVALSIGILVTPEPELLESLFGDIAKVNLTDAVLAVVLSLAVLVIAFLIRRRMMLDIVSTDLAKAQKVNIPVLNLVFLGLVAVVVALGVKVVGTLLMGSLVIIPAAASRNISRNFSSYSLVSLILGAVSALGGVFLSSALNLPPGPMVVLSSATIFLLSLFAKRSA